MSGDEVDYGKPARETDIKTERQRSMEINGDGQTDHRRAEDKSRGHSARTTDLYTYILDTVPPIHVV